MFLALKKNQIKKKLKGCFKVIIGRRLPITGGNQTERWVGMSGRGDAQVKDWGWRTDTQEVKMVNITKKESKSMSVWEQGTEK